MEWTPGGVSGDVEDRRDEGGGGGGGGFGFGRLGLGGILIVGVLSLIFQKNLFVLFSDGGAQQEQVRRVPDRAHDARDSREVQFVSFVLDDVQDTWTRTLPQEAHRDYRRARLVLFRDLTRSACGTAREAIGPFYCPPDEKVYLDLGFFDELKNRFGAPGEFAQAYVIAHEIGHHLQKIMGIEPRVRRLQEAHPNSAKQLSVRLELQADCYAGVWAHSTQQRRIINQNDIDAGLQAAAAVGDDRLQKQSTGRVVPESFTHGSSAQRTEWFKHGLTSGDLGACQTFRRDSSE